MSSKTMKKSVNAKTFVQKVSKVTINSQKSTGTTYYCLVIDNSASMANLKKDVPRLYVSKINNLMEEAKKNNQQVLGTVIRFDANANVLRHNEPLNNINNEKLLNYTAGGYSTALYSAVQTAVEAYLKTTLQPNDAVLVEVLTDGEENSSSITAATFVKLLKEKQQTGQWTFVFQLPMGSKQRFVQVSGVPEENVREWETTTKGLENTTIVTSQAVGSYMHARSRGLTSTTTFYKDLDVSDVSSKDLKILDNVSHRFKAFEVKKEEEIREFVERVLNNKMVLGQAFYELTKPELLREGREILIVEKNRKTIWGGPRVRELLELPKNGDVKVNPHNLSAYKIYFKSTSNNRKLVRGTTVLVDVTKSTNDSPTWETTV